MTTTPTPGPIPSAVRPMLNGTSPTALSSPVVIPNFGTAPGGAYTEYVAATTLFIKPGMTYGDGARLGYEMLTGGAPPDFAIGCFAARVHAARVAASQAPDVGHGCMDVWRLLMENNLDVAAVIARIGS